MDVDGVEDNGTARDELVDAEIVRFGGLGEFFTPWDLHRGGGEQTSEKNDDQGNNLEIMSR